MAYEVKFTVRAEKLLGALPKVVQARVAKRVAALAVAPRGGEVLKLTSIEPPVYRAKAGRDHRIVFAIDDSRQLVLVVWVGNRRDAYRA